jgi:hypothetical protein
MHGPRPESRPALTANPALARASCSRQDVGASSSTIRTWVGSEGRWSLDRVIGFAPARGFAGPAGSVALSRDGSGSMPARRSDGSVAARDVTRALYGLGSASQAVMIARSSPVISVTLTRSGRWRGHIDGGAVALGQPPRVHAPTRLRRPATDVALSPTASRGCPTVTGLEQAAC